MLLTVSTGAKAMRQLAASVPHTPACTRGLAWLPTWQQPSRLARHTHGSRSPHSTPPRQAAASSTHSSSGVDSGEVQDVDWLERSRLLVGEDSLARLRHVNVLLVGLGGVGGFAAEFLCRAGVGAMTIVDGDEVDPTNRNRQLLALRSTQGQPKARVLGQRLLDINPALKLTEVQAFLGPDNAPELVSSQQYSYVVDCIDSIAPKQYLLLAAVAAGLPAISSMGAGGRLDPSLVKVADISQTYNDPFAATIRRGLRKHGVRSGVTVVFSEELARRSSLALTRQQFKRSYFGTSSYIPALFGLHIAAHVVRDVVDRDYHSAQKRLVARLRKKERREAYINGGSSSGSTSSMSEANNIRPLPSMNGSRPDSPTSGGKAVQHVHGATAFTTTASSSSTSSEVMVDETGAQQVRRRAAAVAAGSTSAAQLPQSSHGGSSSSSSSGGSSSSSSSSKRGEVDPPPRLLASFEQADGEGVGFDGSGI